MTVVVATHIVMSFGVSNYHTKAEMNIHHTQIGNINGDASLPRGKLFHFG
jgi:hypothetical protein